VSLAPRLTAPIYRLTIIAVRIVWDEPKRLANLDKHGMDFAVLDLGFFEQAHVIQARRGRMMAIGRLGHDGPLTVIFALLGSEAVTVISMRMASERERRKAR
jgi:uncharacterized DUF497 family protein